jgi:hypothetical protein
VLHKRGFFFICGLALAACPGKKEPPDSGTPDAGPTKVSPVEMCDRLATAKCGLLARCYAAFNRLGPDDCHSFENAQCLDDYMQQQASFDADKAEVDGDHLAQCEARMSQSSCPPTFPPGYSAVAAHPFADCTIETGLIKGKVKSGDTCDRPIECEPNSVCVKPSGVCKGTCSSWPQAGEGCAFGCAPGLFCDDHNTADPNDDTCATPRQQNETCSSSLQCDPELVCTLGQCRPRGGAGQGCVFDANRLSTCEPGLACDVTPFVTGATGTCVLPKAQGAPCQFHWSCAVGMVCSDLVWSGFPGVAPPAGDCRPPSGMGENCGPTQYQSYVGDQCGPGLGCGLSSGTCDVAPKMGESCIATAQNCAGVNVYCKPGGPSNNNGTCTGPVSEGQPCAFTIDASHTVTVPCQTGFCDAQSTQVCRPAYLDVGAVCTVDGECRTNRCAVQQDQSLRCATACQ